MRPVRKDKSAERSSKIWVISWSPPFDSCHPAVISQHRLDRHSAVLPLLNGLRTSTLFVTSAHVPHLAAQMHARFIEIMWVEGWRIYFCKTTHEDPGYCNFFSSHRKPWVRTGGEQFGCELIQNELRLLPWPGWTWKCGGKELTCRGFSLAASSTAV